MQYTSDKRSGSTNTSTCSKCGRVYAPANQGDCIQCPSKNTTWDDPSGDQAFLDNYAVNPSTDKAEVSSNSFSAVRSDRLAQRLHVDNVSANVCASSRSQTTLAAATNVVWTEEEMEELATAEAFIREDGKLYRMDLQAQVSSGRLKPHHATELENMWMTVQVKSIADYEKFMLNKRKEAPAKKP